MSDAIAEIIELMKPASTRPTETPIRGLTLIAGDVPVHQLTALYRPMIGFTVRGTKILSIGGRPTPLPGPCYYLLPVHVPATATVHPGRDGSPYRSIGLEIDPNVLQGLLRDLPEDLLPTKPEDFAACPLDREMAEAWLRLLRLTKKTRDVPALAPVYEREILYRVLCGPQGWYLRQLGLRESGFSKISKVVVWLRDHYRKPFEIEELAARSGMAINTFHRQFKRATGLSPIQFQKQLRLMEARNLIAFEGDAVASAAYRVGYQSASQFNREYSRFFGRPPAKDTEHLKKIEAARA